MRIIDLVHHLLPAGTDAAYFLELPTKEVLNRPEGPRATFPSYALCPIWPPDLFAVTGTIIDQSGCCTEASTNRSDLTGHVEYLEDVLTIAYCWEKIDAPPPRQVQELWTKLVVEHGQVPIAKLAATSDALKTVLQLFAIADEASVGMGWGKDAVGDAFTEFAAVVVLNATGTASDYELPYWPTSLCGMISPDRVIVLPKSVTASVGCTIRSLSHHLALLPCRSVIDPIWRLVSRARTSTKIDPAAPYNLNLLIVPFPFSIPDGSFEVSTPKTELKNKTNVAAFFKLNQTWLGRGRARLTGKRLADELIVPLIQKAQAETGARPDGVILPECSLTPEILEGLVVALVSSGVQFVTAGLLERDKTTGRWLNKAKTFAILGPEGAVPLEQNKHHRWRLDKSQTARYALDFDPDTANDKWWEDIDVAHRQLPFFALRKDVSIVTLICEDLARTDPALNAIRAVGPNLVVALLMDGAQLTYRWPGRYATVLAEDPGSAVLTVTCAGMVDLSNRMESIPRRSIALWRDIDGGTEEILLPGGHQGILMTLASTKRHQTTMDNRSDGELSRKLTLTSHKPLSLAVPPSWL
ncbi:hypothetical protein [Duganella sp. Dugasp56]|uniref:hypothetical protein n=1 Tax=Duganella sp. Dugasp56 TaxID=3243046 RepID=UPI0039B0755D